MAKTLVLAAAEEVLLGEPAVVAVLLPAVTVEVARLLLLAADTLDPVAVAVAVEVSVESLAAPAPPLPPWVGESPDPPVADGLMELVAVADPTAAPEPEPSLLAELPVELLPDDDESPPVDELPEVEVELELATELATELLDEAETPLQLRSYNGVVLRVEPTTPKLGLGVVG